MNKFNINTKKTSTLSSKKESKIIIKIVEQKKIQMTQKIASKEIMKKTRDIDAKQNSRKNILITRYRFEKILVLKISNEKSRKALRNDKD